MAASKEKLIESAQKNLKKKQVAKAIRDYLRVVELDPADMRSRQKLAELYVRAGQKTEAYEQYESVAKYFSSNGFYPKAIAIYKQMQRLDPGQVAIFNRLAELNEKQGLLGDAMSEYRNLVDYYERNGMVADQIRTLEKMHALDPNNLNIRIKLAETYARNERPEEGFAELEKVLEILSDRGGYDKVLKLYKMFLPLFPNSRKLQMGLALAFYEKGDFQRGVTILETLLKDKPEDPDLLRLVGRGYADDRQHDKAREIFQKLLQMDATDLDIREALIRVELASGDYPSALEELEEWKEAFFKSDRLEFLRDSYELLKEQQPGNTAVLQTLDSIYELTGEGDKILDIISEQENEPEDEEDDDAEETLSDALLGSAEADIHSPEDSFELTEEPDVVEEETLDLQLEALDDDAADGDLESGSEAVIELAIDDSFEAQPDDTENDLLFDLGDEEEAPSAEAAQPRSLQADLEEAEFYLQQGLNDEAEKLYRDILEYAPDTEECRTKLAELEQLREQTPDAEAPVDSGTTSADEDLFDFSFDFDPADVPGADDQEKKVFRTDVDEQIAADDMESHYNLGIAYREMGLFDDAISEFSKAQKEPARFVDCQTLKGLCYSDQGDYDSAESMFREALAAEHLEEIQRLNLGYELALLHERAGKPQAALDSYREVLDLDRNYRDVAERIAELKTRLGLSEKPADPPAAEENKQRISFL